MSVLSRALARALAPLLLLAPLPGAAQDSIGHEGAAGASPAPAPSTQAAPSLPPPAHARPDDPWIYRGTDIPVDREWLFGEMPSGLRYAVRSNAVPPGQVSIRVRIDAGSLHERDEERGFAHLLEHLVFRESKYLGNGEAIAHFQRLGASLGNDTNATTSPTQTVYQIDLPDARPQTLEESVRLLAGMVREPTLSAANVATEVPIVLAERRERSGPERRIAEATREVFFAGQRLAERSPIGTVETLRAATPDAVRAFHSRWYRPDKAVVVIVGDADPLVFASLVERYFGDWEAVGEPEPEPDFGEPAAPSDETPPGDSPLDRTPVGEVRVLIEPGQPRALTYGILRPWVEVVDNLEYNRGMLIDAVAEAIVNRRLEARARGGGSFLYAAVGQDKTSRSADGTFVSLAPLTDDWQAALTDVRAVIADALAEPPAQAEIDREVAEFDVVFANLVEQSRIQAGSRLANDLVTAVDIREAVASPETVLEVFRTMRDRFTPAAIHEHTRALFSGTVARGLLLTPEPGAADAGALRAALLAPVAGTGGTAGAAEAIAFADLPPIGEPAAPIAREPLGVFDAEKIEFANGVRALLWPTTNEPGRATVRVRFGRGISAFSHEEAAYVALGKAALVSMGLGPLDQNDLDRIASGRKLGFDFRIEDGTFVFDGATRAEDVADQLYLFAGKLAMPRWDAAPFERAKASMLLSYGSYAGNPSGILNRDLDWLLRDSDPRFATPTPAMLEQTSPEAFEQVWSRLLATGPVEVDVFGDFDREEAVAALSRTFGALAPRSVEAGGAQDEAPVDGFPAASAEPLVVTHEGEADQAAAVIAWPTGGGSDNLTESRRLELLSQLFSNRLLETLRERAGASYSPYVASEWPRDVAAGGRIFALAQLPPEQVPEFFAAAEEIAADLAINGPDADELARVTEPMRQLLNRMQTGHMFWLEQLAGAAFDDNRVASLGTLLGDFTRISPEEVQTLAARYFSTHGGWRLAVLPGGAAPLGGDAGSGAEIEHQAGR